MFDFLKKAVVVAEEQPKKSAPARKERTPLGMALRLFYDGSIYPSEALIKRFNLEYSAKVVNEVQELVMPAVVGNGFDVFSSVDYPAFKIDGKVICIAPVSKTAPKVDLFASVGYDEKGAPKASVLDQGSVTFGKDNLIPMLEAVYGIKLDKTGKTFIDLRFAGPDLTENTHFELPDNKTITYFPKKIVRGEKKGETSVERRENPQWWALIPAEEAASGGAEPTEVKEEIPVREEAAMVAE